MTLYEVNYRSDDAPNGIARLFFTSRRAAAQACREIRRDYQDAVKAYEAAVESGVEYYSMPVAPGESPIPEIEDLKFTGTHREQMLQALRHARL